MQFQMEDRMLLNISGVWIKGLRFLPHRMREVQIVDAFDVLYYATIEVQVT